MFNAQKHDAILTALFNKNIISKDNLIKINQLFMQQNKSLLNFLIEDIQLNSQIIAMVIAEVFNYPLVNLNYYDHHKIPKQILPHFTESFVRKFHLLPLTIENKVLFVVVSDPEQAQQLNIVESIQDKTGLTTQLQLADHQAISTHINLWFNNNNKIDQSLTNSSTQHQKTSNSAQQPVNLSKEVLATKQLTLNHLSDQGNAVVDYIDKLLNNAIDKAASDIHFEPYQNCYRIRFRIDGILTEVDRLSNSVAEKFAARLKVVASLDIAERRLPQDGRFIFNNIENEHIHIRINTLPTLWGEKIVIRVLNSTKNLLSITQLGFSPMQQKAYLNALQQPQGLILVTGPTGSGKTMSLYSGLQQLNTAQLNISTAEDPIEISLEGINQVQINLKIGLSFAKALRSFLRQDPDVIMVGEVRDLETAEIAIKAAQTGHLVLSTLHTNSAIETITRLQNMGIASYNLASAISLVIAQRLLRKLCSHCKIKEQIPANELQKQGFSGEQIANATLYQAVGCQHCHQGYHGRIAIVELLNIDLHSRQLIMQGATIASISQQSQKMGLHSLRQSGIEKVIAGNTSLTELNRVMGSN